MSEGDMAADHRFRDRVALVTGGSSGIGLAMAKQLAAQGAHVWLIARDRGRLDAALVQVEAARTDSQQRCGVVSADLADGTQAAAAIMEVIDRAGVPDLVMNSAGVAHPGYFQDLNQDIFHWMMDVNYFGTVHVTKAVVPPMITRGSGHIVNMSSIAGFLGVYGYTAYGASKFAVRGFSDVLRAELKPFGIGVSVVFPPDTDTPQLTYENQFKPFETKELAGSAHALSPDAVASTILREVARKRYIIIPGLEGKLYYWLSGFVGTGLYPIMDLMVGQARRKKRS
jgi:3-dehydrosphinganine reductase